MPTDSNGNYALPAGYLATTGNPIVVTQHNPIFEDVASAITGRLMASGANAMTGQLKGIDGAVGTPAFSFASSVTTGFYKTSGGNIGVTINGAETVEFGPGGIVKGARYLGELFPCVLSTAPALCVFPVGQTLSRTTYAALWALAQTEIAAGNTFFNNGDGSTTFGIGDLRGRVIAAKDPSTTVLTGLTMTPDGNTIGAKGGSQMVVLTTLNLPAYTPTGTNSGGAASFQYTQSSANWGAGSSNTITAINTISGIGLFTSFTQPTFHGDAQGGSSTPVVNTQPTMVTNYALFAGA